MHNWSLDALFESFDSKAYETAHTELQSLTEDALKWAESSAQPAEKIAAGLALTKWPLQRPFARCQFGWVDL